MVWAIAEGRLAAAQVDSFLKNEGSLDADLVPVLNCHADLEDIGKNPSSKHRVAV